MHPPAVIRQPFAAGRVSRTPVINVDTNTIFVVARTQETDGSIKYRLHAMDLGDGREKSGGPVIVGTADPAFDPKMHLNRPGLLLSPGRVYIAFGSECDHDPFHGWIFAHDQASLGQVAPGLVRVRTRAQPGSLVTEQGTMSSQTVAQRPNSFIDTKSRGGLLQRL
jgi:hypothetical protein